MQTLNTNDNTNNKKSINVYQYIDDQLKAYDDRNEVKERIKDVANTFKDTVQNTETGLRENLEF